MPQLPKHLAEFVTRDIVYALGGTTVIASLLHKFDRLPDSDTPGAYFILAASIGWLVGGALQAAFIILGVVSTGAIKKPSRIKKWVYRRITGDAWQDLPQLDQAVVAKAVLKALNEDEYRRWHYERRVMHVITSATMTPCAFVASTLLLWRSWREPFGFDFACGIGGLLLTVIFAALNWTKVMEMARADANIHIEQQQSD